MFRIEEAPFEVPVGQMKTYVVDHDRDVWLKRVVGHGAQQSETLKLVRRGQVIAFDVQSTPQHDDPDFGRYMLTEFLTFGGSVHARGQGIGNHTFLDANDKREAQLLAAEALLIYGGLYDGEGKPESFYRVKLRTDDGNTAIYTLASFGYSTS